MFNCDYSDSAAGAADDGIISQQWLQYLSECFVTETSPVYKPYDAKIRQLMCQEWQ